MMLAMTLFAALASFPSLPSFARVGDTSAVRDTTRAAAVPPWWEAGVAMAGESFASRLAPWQWHSAAVRYRGKSASHAIEAFAARRYDQWNGGVAVEESRTVGRGAYIAVRAQLAPRATIVARSDLSASWYQSLGNGWETVPSVRVMTFAERIPIIGVGLGRYTGLWYVAGRASDATERGEHGITATGEIRRYAADASSNFVDLTVSHGSDVVVLGSTAVGLRATSSIAARGQRMITRGIGISLTATYDANASLPDRRGGALSAFVRW